MPDSAEDNQRTIEQHDELLRRALERAADAERRLEDITRLVSDWVWEVDRELRLTYLSPRILNILGRHPQEFVGRRFGEIGTFQLHVDGATDFMELRMPFRDEPFEAIDAKKRVRIQLISGIPVFDPRTDEFTGYRGTAEDITERKNAEDALRESERTAHAFLNATMDGATLLDPDGTIVAVNEASARRANRTINDMVGTNFLNMDLPVDTEIRRNVFERVKLTGQADRNVRQTNGVWTDVSTYPIHDENGVLEKVAVFARDVTELKQTEAALRESEERFRDFADSTADRMWEMDTEFRITYISPPAEGAQAIQTERLYGLRRWEVPGADPDKDLWAQHEADLRARRSFRDFRFRQIMMASGEVRHLKISGQPNFDDDGKFLGYRGTTIDETDSVRAREAAAGLQNRFFTAMENFSEGFAMWDADERFLHCNSQFASFNSEIGHTLVLGCPYDEFLRALAGRGRRPGYDESMGTEEWIADRRAAFDDTTRVLEGQVGDAWYEVRKQRLPDGTLVVLQADTTATRAREDEIRESREFLRLVADSIPAFLAYRDRENRYIYANQYHERLGYDAEWMIGKTYAEIHGDDAFARVKQFADQALTGETVTFSSTIIATDGKEVDTEASLQPAFDARGEVQGYYVLALDVTERRLAEAELAESKANLDASQRIANLGSWERNLVDNTLFWSDELYRIHGLDSSDEKMTFEQLLERIVPEDRAIIVDRQSLALSRNENRYQNDYRIQRPDGTVRIIEGQAEVTYDHDGTPLRLTGTAQDVTEQRRAAEALEAARAEAERANRAKSDFLSSMSHELRTPMNAVLGYAQLLLQNRKEPLTGLQDKQVSQILKSGHHLLDLINGILDLAKIEAGKVEMDFDAISTRGLIDESIELINALAERHGISIVDQTARDIPEVRADQTRLRQALLNLLSNGIKYNRPGGTVTLACKIEREGTLKICVRDNGIGIATERQSELFEPFSRLGAETGNVEGTGIGLIITKQLVELMDGEIGFESEVDQGSEFWFTLPLATAQQEVPIEPAPQTTQMDEAASRAERGGRLLYIEDDPSNLLLMEEIMANFPRVEYASASDAERGIQIAQQLQPTVILMDISLPGMDGFEARRRLKADQRTENARVIALSAAAMVGDISRGEEAGFFGYLTKPIDVVEALSMIERAFDETPSAAQATQSPQNQALPEHRA